MTKAQADLVSLAHRLRQIEAHHLKLNARAGRDPSRSKTLALTGDAIRLTERLRGEVGK